MRRPSSSPAMRPNHLPARNATAARAHTWRAAPLLATKLYLPRPRGALVPRPQLLARLAAGTRLPLTLIAAPAGFGKTTLLADWLRQDERVEG